MIGAAVILAGGRGSRLAPWPAPKCLVPVRGVPLLERLLAHLEAAGVPRVVICTGYRASDVARAVARRPAPPAIFFSDAGPNAAMGERLLLARREYGLGGERVLVCYGDELADVDLGALARHHAASGQLMTFVACSQRVPFGVVRGGNGVGGTCRIEDGEALLANIGFALAEPAAWDLLLPSNGLSDWVNRLAATKRANYFLHEGRRASVNDLADLQRAEEVWA